MAHSSQARKRNRQSEKRRIWNKSARNEIKTLTKTLREKVSAKDVEAARTLFRKITSKLDKAAKNHVYHRNGAARRKSMIAVLMNTIASPASGTAGR